MMTPPSSYDTWTREELVARLAEYDKVTPQKSPDASLSRVPGRQVPGYAGSSSAADAKTIDFSNLPRRKIALKFSYAGSEYSGLAYQKLPSALPTVEGVLWDALTYTRLVDGPAGMDATGWEKCGRTDAGVSSAGQVISFWVRSNLDENAVNTLSTARSQQEHPAPQQPSAESVQDSDDGPGLEGDLGFMGDLEPEAGPVALPTHLQKKAEFRYISMLNRVLPPTIRVLAWSPVAPDFSARHNCKYRHYKYFFDAERLNIDAMRDAASRLVGEHDFRNLSTLDPSKQLTSFNRRILRAEISPVAPEMKCAGGMHVFDLVGRAFLFNQVRRIMAVLMLVGTELEPPSVVSALLNADPEHPAPAWCDAEDPPPVLERSPVYRMADPLPLVLWDCGYDDADVRWYVDGDDPTDAGVAQEEGTVGGDSHLYAQMDSIRERSAIHAALDAHFVASLARYHRPPAQYFPLSHKGYTRGAAISGFPSAMQIPTGGGVYHRSRTYVPLLQRQRLEHFSVINERYRTGKGARREERRDGAARVDVEDE
ncbi:pseudouridine synthase [Punctularia strigosozonata HHB-11173 SS5]|uniref:pseudouridine synthase n=1 Tax=Punctularia strigosozonata (strain HHB-11173) TaxID=741275 RepID=UPI0004417894|nr:pseudouridine synthase [Punctularia strigosozonata HHB-11173 SS5]EIN05839.1 pseudouridine synthase [Punctularia strigosozonata HHB-11173 SS5]